METCPATRSGWLYLHHHGAKQLREGKNNKWAITPLSNLISGLSITGRLLLVQLWTPHHTLGQLLWLAGCQPLVGCCSGDAAYTCCQWMIPSSVHNCSSVKIFGWKPKRERLQKVKIKKKRFGEIWIRYKEISQIMVLDSRKLVFSQFTLLWGPILCI